MSSLFSRYFVANTAGMFVAYSAPRRHEFLKVVENNYCASRRGIHSLLSVSKMYFSFPYICFVISIRVSSNSFLLNTKLFMYM